MFVHSFDDGLICGVWWCCGPRVFRLLHAAIKRDRATRLLHLRRPSSPSNIKAVKPQGALLANRKTCAYSLISLNYSVKIYIFKIFQRLFFI